MRLDDKTVNGLGRQELIDRVNKILDDIDVQAAQLAARNQKFRSLLERTQRELSVTNPDPDGFLLEDIRAALREPA